MVIDYYTDATPPNTLLKQGLTSGAYINGVGWSHQGLINLSKKYGFTGKAYDYSKSPSATAYEKFTKQLSDGPVIASIHYKFDPKSTIPHLVVINGIKDGVVYYNDPAAKVGNQHISVTAFLKGWKQRYIVVRPA